MSEQATFKDIIGYLDDLHRDTSQLVVLVERLLGEHGYEPLPSAGNRASWNLTSRIDNPGGWRVKYVARCYVETGEEAYEHALCLLVLLEEKTAFAFPTVLCARLEHPPLSEKVIYNKVFHADRLKSLAQRDSDWKNFRDVVGWTVAEPNFTYDTPVTLVRGYLLNLFEMTDRQMVVDNIVNPLVRSEQALGDLLTIPRHAFPDQQGPR